MLSRMRCLDSLLTNGTYVDDGHLVGHPVDLLKCIDTISRMGQSLGMELNLSKCIVFGSTSSTSHLPTDHIRAVEGINVLGSPVGTDLYMANQTDEIVSKVGAVMFEYKFLEDPQMELLILRYCTEAHKVTHWLRTCSSNRILALFNKLLVRCLAFFDPSSLALLRVVYVQ